MLTSSRLLLRLYTCESTDEPIQRLCSKISGCKLPLLMIFLSEHVFFSLLVFLAVQLRYPDAGLCLMIAIHTVTHIVEAVILPVYG